MTGFIMNPVKQGVSFARNGGGRSSLANYKSLSFGEKTGVFTRDIAEQEENETRRKTETARARMLYNGRSIVPEILVLLRNNKNLGWNGAKRRDNLFILVISIIYLLTYLCRAYMPQVIGHKIPKDRA